MSRAEIYTLQEQVITKAKQLAILEEDYLQLKAKLYAELAKAYSLEGKG